MTTRELLSETVESARRREMTVFGAMEVEVRGKVILFGAGRLGRKVAAALRRSGVKPVAFADNNPELVGTNVDGITVSSPAIAAKRWGIDSLFVVTTFRPDGGGVRSRLQELAALGCQRTTSFLPLGWRYDEVMPHFAADLPSRLLGHAEELARVAELWCDDISRETFRRELAWRLRASFDEASNPAPDQYFPRDILRPNPSESFIDGGAFDGDTLRSAPWPFDWILAIEPDPANAARLRSFSGGRFQVREVLLGCVGGFAHFNATGTMEASRSDSGTLQIAVAPLDDLAVREHPTFIKLDLEGDELAALHGSRRTLENSQPVVAVCAYHRPEDLWTIPLFLNEVLPRHKMFLRLHAWDGFELVIYAVPPARYQQPS